MFINSNCYRWCFNTFKVVFVVCLFGCVQPVDKEEIDQVENIQQQIEEDPPRQEDAAEKVLPITFEPETVRDYTKVPNRCLPFRELIEEFASRPSRTAATVEQESGCRPYVVSFDGGEGLMQFTGKTGPWLADGLCRNLGPYQPFNPKWAIPCGIRYMESLTKGETLNDIRIGEMRYNGGYWIIWEIKEAVLNGLQPTIVNARKFCGKRLSNGKKRAEKWCDWNYAYYEHIERREPKYASYLVK